MKKLFVLILAVAASISVASAQNWGIGGRLGNGLEVVGQRVFENNNYLEARLGIGFLGDIRGDLSMLYVWNVKNWDWTPGNWFLDIGAGANVGIDRYYLFVGAQAMGKFGYTFENIPLSLGVDFSPVIGPYIGLKKGYKTGFYMDGLFYNWALSCVYRF